MELKSAAAMKFGLRIPSLKKRIAARTSVRRLLRHSLDLKAPRGLGWLTNPKRALYNRIYNRTTRGCLVMLLGTVGAGLFTPLFCLVFIH